jgi:hypothetical protein
MFVPNLRLITTLVFGIFSIVESAPRGFESILFRSTPLSEATGDWIPGLSFSCALDAITTSMIAGRLGYVHFRQRKIVAYRSASYMSILVIFVESAVLSLVSKGLHLGFRSNALLLNPIVIPICVCSSSGSNRIH